MASAAFVHVTRVGLLFARHRDDLDLPDQERRRVLMRPAGGSNLGRDPGVFEFRVRAKEMFIEGETEEVPCIADLAPSVVTFRDLTRPPRNAEPEPTKEGEARAIVDDRLADGKWHPSMIGELVELGFTKSTAYRAAEHCVKRQSSKQEWWWAAPGTPKSTFVENDENTGTAPSRARRTYRHGNSPAKTQEYGSERAIPKFPRTWTKYLWPHPAWRLFPPRKRLPASARHRLAGVAPRRREDRHHGFA